MKQVITHKLLLVALLFCASAVQATPVQHNKKNHLVQATSTPDNKKIHIDQIAFNMFATGDGFGMQYAPEIGIRFGKRIVASGGPVFCSEDWRNTGYIADLRYLMLNEEESFNGRMRLSFVLSFQHYKSECLSDGTIRMEARVVQSLQPEEKAAFENMRFSGWQGAVGFGMSYTCRFGLFFRSEVGLSYYNSANNEAMNVVTFRQNKSACLKLGAGIGWRFQ